MSDETQEVIVLDAIPYQQVLFLVNDDEYVVEVRQIGEWLYTSTMVNGEQITENVRATVDGKLLPYPHARVKTTVRWVDTSGNEDPQYEGLGTRWFLAVEE